MPGRGAHPLEQVVDYYCDMLPWASSGHPRAELSAAAKWLRDNIYEPEHLALCWGDSRLSNILYGPQFEVAGGPGLGDRLYRRPRGRSGLAAVHSTGPCSEYQGVPRLDGHARIAKKPSSDTNV